MFGLLAPGGPVEGELDLAAPSAVAAGSAHRDPLTANSANVGDTVSATVGGGATLGVRIVAVVSTFPTVTSPYGAVIVDLPTMQDYLADRRCPRCR